MMQNEDSTNVSTPVKVRKPRAPRVKKIAIPTSDISADEVGIRSIRVEQNAPCEYIIIGETCESNGPVMNTCELDAEINDAETSMSGDTVEQNAPCKDPIVVETLKSNEIVINTCEMYAEADDAALSMTGDTVKRVEDFIEDAQSITGDSVEPVISNASPLTVYNYIVEGPCQINITVQPASKQR